MPTDADDTLFPFSLPSPGKKKITAAFDGGQISSDGGVLLLAWCEDNAVQYVFGLSKNEILDALVFDKADEVRTRRAIGNLDTVRDFTETSYAAKSWSRPRRVVARIEARIEATRKGLDIRYVVTSIARCGAASLYGGIYWARGQAEISPA